MQMLQQRSRKGVGEPEFELDLDLAPVEPLWRLEINRDILQQWLSRREAAIHKVVERPPVEAPAKPSRDSVAAMSADERAAALFNSHYYQKPGQTEEFEGRVAKHLATVRRRLLDIVKYRVVNTGRNKVNFTVRNGTSKSARDVQLVIKVPVGVETVIYNKEPMPLPSFPQWHSSLGMYSVDPHELPNLTRMLYTPPPLSGTTNARTERNDDGTEITVRIGDLTPGEQRAFGPVTFVVGPRQVDAIDIDLIGRAMDRSGSKTVPKRILISENAWRLEDLVPPDEQPAS